MGKDARRPAGQPHVSLPDWPHSGIAGLIGELQTHVSLRGARTHDEFMTGLSDVVHRGDAFLDAFGGTAWGHIVWEKGVGVPLSPRLADAFLFTHQFQELHDEGVNPDGTVEIVPVYRDAAAPRVWDGPHDDEHYRVSFMLWGQPGWANGLGIDLDRTVQWQPRFAPWLDQRMRYVKYPASLQQNAGIFWPRSDSITDFEEFQVLWWPF